jgi:urease alpha subunit
MPNELIFLNFKFSSTSIELNQRSVHYFHINGSTFSHRPGIFKVCKFVNILLSTNIYICPAL